MSDALPDWTGDTAPLRALIASFKALGCRVSLFVDPGLARVADAAGLGADRVELYTGPYAQAFAQGAPEAELARCADTAAAAQQAGLGVNAGHDLSQRNLGRFLAAVPSVAEVSIGHALIGEALYQGMADTVRGYLAILAGAR